MSIDKEEHAEMVRKVADFFEQNASDPNVLVHAVIVNIAGLLVQHADNVMDAMERSGSCDVALRKNISLWANQKWVTPKTH